MKRVFVIMFLFAVSPAMAQLTLLYVDLLQPVYNERGEMLTEENQGFVQFLEVNGQVYPPNLDGSHHENNPLISENYIGQGVGTGAQHVGLFSVSIPPPEGQIIMRVFNAATPEDASFYAETPVYTPNMPAYYYPVPGATTNALDSADDDSDGLNNSWEKSLGSNANLADSDGDGVSDLHEFLAGTDLMNENDYLAMIELIPHAGDLLEIQWDSVPGKSYQLQGSHLSLADPVFAFSNINDVVVASGSLSSTIVTNGLGTEIKQFRVKLLE